MANNNCSFGSGLVSEGVGMAVFPGEEAFTTNVVATGAPFSQQTFTSPPGVEALAALNALAAAAGYAGQHGTPAIDAVLSHAADLRNLVSSGQQEVDVLLSIGDALKTRLADAGMPLPPSPFLTGSAAGGTGTEKKRKNDKLDFESTSKQPRHDTSIKFTLPSLSTTAPTLPPRPLPPPPAAMPGPSSQPSQLQLQQALQQLMRHYQTQMHPHQQTTTSASKPPHVLFHRATPGSAAVPPPPSAPTTAPLKQQQSTPPSASTPSFADVTTALGLHQWSPSEAALLVQFRATCAVLDSVGRDIAFTNVLQLQNSKEAVLDMIRGVVGRDRGNRSDLPTLHSSEGVTTAAAVAAPRQPALKTERDEEES
jgi:hypothetical protein